MSSVSRRLSFSLAINEALRQAMERDPSVVLIGQGVKSPWYVGNTCLGLVEAFGEDRVFDTPVSENAVTGAAVGAALSGLKTVVVHPRMDFMLYAFDPIINEAANWSYMSGGRASVPVVFWGIVNRRGEQAAQHSQALHSIFSHIPGLKVVAPATPCDAKGLMAAALEDPNPVVFVDDRELYGLEEDVPEKPFCSEIGKAAIRRTGKDITVIAFSSMLPKALAAAELLAQDSIETEVLDLRTLKPLDDEAMFSSVRKTGRVLVCDTGWRTGGIGAEIAARISEACWSELRSAVRRIALPDFPAPAARTLEKAYYPDVAQIASAAREVVRSGAERTR